MANRPREAGEAAEVTGFSLRFLYYAIQQKVLPTIRVGRRCRLITEKALREWLERKTEASVETKGQKIQADHPCSSQSPPPFSEITQPPEQRV